MIYFKKISKLSQYFHFYTQKMIRYSNPIIQKWIDFKPLKVTSNPIMIDIDVVLINREEILKAADSVINNRYTVFGKQYEFSGKIPWDTDFNSGFVWGKGVFFKNYIQVNLDNDADVKYPRELSRFHHSLYLGQAFYLTRDVKYYKKFKADLRDWIKENPFMHSINWGCTQDVSIRAVNWVWGMAFFSEMLEKDKTFKNQVERSLYKHGFYIYMYPEKNTYNNHNHYLSDLIGQIYLGLYFNKDRYGVNWLSWGVDELYREIRYQILPSGPSYERSINYNRFVTEMIVTTIIMLKNSGFIIPLDIWYRIELMIEFIMYYTKPDGLAPIIGDQDDARLLPFSFIRNTDHKYLIAIGAVLFNRGDFKYWSQGYYVDCDFLLGKNAKSIYDGLDSIQLPLKSKSYPDAGFYIIREYDDYMFINNSGKSKYCELGGGTHTHSDLLSFELCIGGNTLIIDTGTFVYSGNPKMRKHFRSTMMHNTLVVDNQDQNVIDQNQLWDFDMNAIPKTLKWEATDKKVVFVGTHTGYRRLSDPVNHQRQVTYSKETKVFEITDTIEAKEVHNIKLYFHFDAGIELEILNKSVEIYGPNNSRIVMEFDSKHESVIQIEQGMISKSYGHADKSNVVCVEINTEGYAKIVTKIMRKN